MRYDDAVSPLSILSLKRAALSSSLFLWASNAWAQGFGGPLPTLPGAANSTDVRSSIVEFLVAALNFLSLLAVVMIVAIGIAAVVTAANPSDESSGKGKKAILYVLVGLVIILFARVIVALVTNYLASQVS